MRFYLTILLVGFIPLKSFAYCFQEVSNKYQISPNLLKAIVYTESRFSPDAVNCANSNKSCDYGFAQINLSAWKGRLNQFGISIEDLKDPCQNLHFGAWVLAQNFKSHGRNWNSVGAYNAGFSKNKQAARERYISKVKSNLKLIESVQGNLNVTN